MSLGTMASEEGARVDFARLRDERRHRLLAAMDRHHVEVLMLGRAANVHYASGARQLWTAGTRAFGPACVVVAGTAQVHLLSVWDEGVPSEIPHHNLYGLAWNPLNLMGSVRAIPGVATAATIGTDGLSPGFADLLPTAAPNAALVDGAVVVLEARRDKTADELGCIAIAVAMAEAGMTAMVDMVKPGVTERQLVGAFLARMAELGGPTPATEGVVCGTPRRGPVRLRQLATDRPIGPAELVALSPGALFAGYEGGLGRTWLAGAVSPSSAQRQLAARCRAGLDALVAACRAGSTGAHLRRAWATAGEPAPSIPLAFGLGLGVEPPVVADAVGGDAVLRTGDVLSVQAWVAEEGVGGFLERDVIVITDGDADVLSRFGHGPAA